MHVHKGRLSCTYPPAWWAPRVGGISRFPVGRPGINCTKSVVLLPTELRGTPAGGTPCELYMLAPAPKKDCAHSTQRRE